MTKQTHQSNLESPITCRQHCGLIIHYSWTHVTPITNHSSKSCRPCHGGGGEDPLLLRKPHLTHLKRKSRLRMSITSKPRKWARVTEQGYSEMRSFQALEATLVDIVMRNGWPIAITAWPAKVNQNLKREIKQKSVRLTGGNDSGVVDDDADLVTGFRWSVSPGIVEKRRVRPPTNIHEEPQRTPAWWWW